MWVLVVGEVCWYVCFVLVLYVLLGLFYVCFDCGECMCVVGFWIDVGEYVCGY